MIIKKIMTSDTSVSTMPVNIPDHGQMDLKVCQIDDQADQIIGINTTSLEDYGCTIGAGVTAALTNVSNWRELERQTTFTGTLKRNRYRCFN